MYYKSNCSLTGAVNIDKRVCQLNLHLIPSTLPILIKENYVGGKLGHRIYMLYYLYLSLRGEQMHDEKFYGLKLSITYKCKSCWLVPGNIFAFL